MRKYQKTIFGLAFALVASFAMPQPVEANSRHQRGKRSIEKRVKKQQRRHARHYKKRPVRKHYNQVTRRPVRRHYTRTYRRPVRRYVNTYRPRRPYLRPHFHVGFTSPCYDPYHAHGGHDIYWNVNVNNGGWGFGFGSGW